MIIGASGLLGNSVLRLGRDRYELFGTYNSHIIKGDTFFRLDVRDRRNVFKIVEKVRPSLVIDTHALNNVDYCETHPEEAWNINVDGTRNAAEASKIAGAKYVFISTDYVFDGKKMSYNEKDKPKPLNYYAKSKLAAEMILEALDINCIIARTAVLYGNGGEGKKPFVLWLVENLKKKQKVNIVSDQHNNPTFVDNLAEIIFRLCEIDARGLFHVTGKECVSRYNFSISIAGMFGLDKSLIKPITTPELNQVAKRPEKVNMSTNKAERVSGINTLNVDEGLKLLKKQLVSR